MEFSCGIFRLRALRQAEQVVRLLTVALRLQVFVSIPAGRYDHPDALPADAHVEPSLSRFNSSNGAWLGQLPAFASWIYPADVLDGLMRIVSVALVDAFYLVA